jgi:hypothetical protein
MKIKRKFIAKAIKRPGALTKRAKSKGKSVAGEAAADEHKSGLAGQQARFYENVLKPANVKRRHTARIPKK